jgi:hypothetical protein
MKRVITAILGMAALAAAADLPVKQVVLYKHGVGYFERSGTLAPGESARLEFNAAEMNDVLKSLTISEPGGGKVSGLRYDSMDPLSHRLADFPFQIGASEPLAAMLDQLKGARLELRFGGETVTGAIVGGRLVLRSDNQPEREQLTLMLDGGELRTVDLSAATGIRFTDATLQGQFRDYLAALEAARSKEKRSVYIDSTDARAREVVASYMVPSPVWKSSYRLIFGPSGQPVLEGWAIVDNTTGEDWNKVQLSLVSGRPISFVSQLYAPRYVERPAVELAEDSAARPVVHEGGYGAGLGTAAGPVSGMGGGVMGGVIGGVPAAAPARRNAMTSLGTVNQTVEVEETPVRALPSDIVANASAGELGELFEYRIAQPVTIRKSESAMLPFLQQPIEARKLLIYSDHTSQHPTDAAEIANTSGKTLDGGPITVYDGGAYGGEALMETLKAKDKRLISYAVDLGTRITEAFGSKASIVREIHANRGMLTTKLASEETRTYTVRNVDQKAKTLIIEHPLRPMYTLLNQKPSEKTANAYRFEVQIAADATREFTVSEERVFDQTYAVTNVTPDLLVEYAGNRAIGDTGRAQLQHIADLKTQEAEADRGLHDADSQTTSVTADEERIRRNIASLNVVSGQQQQVQDYARQLAVSEQQLAALRDRKAELQKKKTALDGELNKAIEALSF